MNKYQETLEFIKSLKSSDRQQEANFRNLENIVQELVDKETPKKVLKNTNYDNCPVCYMPLVDYDKDDVSAVYCKYCGTRLDWR